MSVQRHQRLTAAMGEAGLDALFVSNPKNVLYLTGFKTTMPGEVQPFGDPEGFLVIHQGECNLLCDGRYIAGAKQLAGVTAHLIESPSSAKTFADQIRRLVGGRGQTVGFERDALLHVDAVGLLELLPDIDWKPAEHVVAGLRLIKSAEEIALIRRAQAITSQCFEHMAAFLKPGMTERQAALEIDRFLRVNSEGNSFAPIVAFGETSCHPHYTPSPTRKLERGQLVLLDFGAIHEGYCGDMTRMVFMGEPDARTGEVYELVLAAQQRCLDGLKPGLTCHEADALCRGYFEGKGCAEAFMHGTGHGVGLAIHEDPRLKRTFMAKLEPGMVFSVEPGLYYSGWGGIRIEDLVAMTSTGIENLTTTPKRLLTIPA